MSTNLISKIGAVGNQANFATDSSGNPVGFNNPSTGTLLTGFSMLRDKIRKAYTDASSKPYYSTFWNLPPAWTPGETIRNGQGRSSNGNWYIAITSGTTGAFAPNLTNPLLTQPYSGWWDGAVDGSGSSGVKWVYYSAAQPVYTGDQSTTVNVSFSLSNDASLTNIYAPLTGNYGTPTSWARSSRTNSTKQFIPVGSGCTAEFATWTGDLMKSPKGCVIVPTPDSVTGLALSSQNVSYNSAGNTVDNGIYWEFNTDSSKIQIQTARWNTVDPIRVWVDDIEVAPTGFWSGLSGDTASIYITVSMTGIKKIRNVKIETNYIRDVRVLPNAALYYVQEQPLNILWIGDSIGAGSAEGPSRGANANWPGQLANKLGIKGVTNISVGGTGFYSPNNGIVWNYLQRITNNSIPASNPTSDILSYKTIPFDIAVIQVSGNDGVAYTPEQYQTQALAIFRAMRTLQPTALIIVHGPYPGSESGGYPTAANYCDVQAQAAFATWNDPNSVYILTRSTAPGGPWVTGSGYSNVGNISATGNASYYVGSDSLHPLDAGINFLGQQTYTALKTILNI